MNDESRVAEDALVVPLGGGNVATLERTQREKRRALRRLRHFLRAREPVVFRRFGVKVKERPKEKKENGALAKNARGAPNAANVVKKRLLADAEAFDERNVTRLIFAFQVVEKAATIANHLKETAAGRVILFVDFHVFGQRVNFFRQQRDLDFRGPDVGIAAAVFGDDRLFFFFGHNRHINHLVLFGKSTSERLNAAGRLR